MHLLSTRVLPALFFCAVAAACSSTSDPKPQTQAVTKYKPTVLPALGDVKTTAEITLSPTHARQSYKDGPNPAAPDARDNYLKNGFGDTAPGPGWSYVTRVIDGSTPPAPGPNAKRLLRFAHVPDFQLMDDESPTRLGGFDAADLTTSALRPQDPDMCRMANAAVRTVNALNKKDPISFVLLGGDNADSAQDNEVDWFLQILGGAPEVECDSGGDDDIVPGPDNDGKDPFVAEGLAVPFKWVTGNHDVLVQGNLPVDQRQRDLAIGNVASGGTRDYALPGGPNNTGDFVIVDQKRKLLSRVELMQKVSSHGDGHGLGEANRQSGKAFYTFDAPGTPIRFVILDSAAETGGSEGVLHMADWDKFIKPALDQAKAEKKWVILASHHSVTNLTADGGAFGAKQADAILPDQWKTLVGGYDNVVFSIVGHSHEHRVRPIQPAQGHAWWEVMTSAIADYPHQFRVIEIFDQDNGWIMLRGTCVDLAVDGDPVAAEGRKLGVIDFTSGWVGGANGDGPGKPEDRNVEIWIKKPQ
jgi:3',5'-cyclic AMP phosphodiesterase CpdA